MIIKGFPWYILVFLLLSSITSCDSSSSSLLDPHGYDGLQWGASIDAVKSKYPEAVLNAESDALKDERRDGAVASREFKFYKDKLIEVSVMMTGVESDLIYQKLIEKYEKPHKNDSFKGAEVFVWEFDTTLIHTMRLLPYSMTTVYYKSTNLTKQRIEQEIEDSIKARTSDIDRQNKEMSETKL